jgi:hypothetical protein
MIRRPKNLSSYERSNTYHRTFGPLFAVHRTHRRTTGPNILVRSAQHCTCFRSVTRTFGPTLVAFSVHHPNFRPNTRRSRLGTHHNRIGTISPSLVRLAQHSSLFRSMTPTFCPTLVAFTVHHPNVLPKTRRFFGPSPERSAQHSSVEIWYAS